MKNNNVEIQEFTPEDLLFDIEAKELKDLPEEQISITKERKKIRQKTLLAYYLRNVGQITLACEQAGVDYSLHLWWKKNDPAYAEAFDNAEQMTLDAVNAEIVRRGITGFEEPVFYKGERRDTIRKWSDNLLMFRAKRLDPAYRDNYNQNVSVGTINIRVVPPQIEAPRQVESEVLDGEVLKNET